MRSVLTLAAGVVLLHALAAPAPAEEPVAMKVAAPDVRGTDTWINTKPLALKDLRGKVVVVHFWTFGCVNCVHNLPHYNGWHKDYAEKGVTVLGVHTPETAGEADVDAVRRKVKDFGIKYPVAVDGEAKTWQAWGNQFWPSVYLVDKQGNVRYRWDGELNWKDRRGEKLMRERIEQLLAEKDPKP